MRDDDCRRLSERLYRELRELNDELRPPPTLSDKLAAYYKLEEASGTRYDSSPRGNDLTQNNNPTNTPAIIGDGFLSATASNHRLRRDPPFASDFEMGNFDFAISLWARLDSKGANRRLIQKGVATGQADWQILYPSAADRLRWQVVAPSGTTFNLDSSLGSPVIGQWYHLYVEHDAAAAKIRMRVRTAAADSLDYTDERSTGGAGCRNTASWSFCIGHLANTACWDGAVDEVAIWRLRKLTVPEQDAVWNLGKGLSIDAWSKLKYPIKVWGAGRQVA